MGGRVVRASVGTVFLASLLWFLFICILANQATEMAAATISSAAFTGSKPRHIHRGHPDLNYVSKRRVPNGPDPIHNRRARNSRERPTRV